MNFFLLKCLILINFGLINCIESQVSDLTNKSLEQILLDDDK